MRSEEDWAELLKFWSFISFIIRLLLRFWTNMDPVSEEITAGISKLKSVKKYPAVCIKVTARSLYTGVQVNFPEISLFCNPIIH